MSFPSDQEVCCFCQWTLCLFSRDFYEILVSVQGIIQLQCICSFPSSSEIACTSKKPITKKLKKKKKNRDHTESRDSKSPMTQNPNLIRVKRQCTDFILWRCTHPRIIQENRITFHWDFLCSLPSVAACQPRSSSSFFSMTSFLYIVDMQYSIIILINYMRTFACIYHIIDDLCFMYFHSASIYAIEPRVCCATNNLQIPTTLSHPVNSLKSWGNLHS